MADPINLNRVRKAKARGADQARAAANRVKFGRTKAEKAKTAAETARMDHRLNQTRRDD